MLEIQLFSVSAKDESLTGPKLKSNTFNPNITREMDSPGNGGLLDQELLWECHRAVTGLKLLLQLQVSFQTIRGSNKHKIIILAVRIKNYIPTLNSHHWPRGRRLRARPFSCASFAYHHAWFTRYSPRCKLNFSFLRVSINARQFIGYKCSNSKSCEF